MKELLLKGNVILEDAIHEDAVIRCTDGRIDAIEPYASMHEGKGLLDFTGRYLSPGFVDIHVHGGAGADYMDGTVEAVRRTNIAHARHGTTSIFPTTTTGSFAQLDAMVKACETVQASWTPADGARIAGIHFYGPYFAQDKVGIHAPEGRRDPVREEYEYFLGREIIKIATCASELPGALDFFDHARERGCFITCGHSNACWDELEAAFTHGMRHVDHFWCAMSSVASLRKRFGTPMQAGMEQYVLANPAMSTEVIADGIHLSDDLLRFAFRLIGPQRCCLVTDANRAMDMPPDQYRFGSVKDGSWVWSDGHSVRGQDGSLASSMHGMDRMVRTMAKAIEQDLPAVIRMASLTPAELTGIAGEVGSLAPGKRADIVVLDGDFEVERVFVAGAPLPVTDTRPDQAA